MVRKVTDKDVLDLAQKVQHKENNERESLGEFRRKFMGYLRSRGRLTEEPRAGLRPSGDATLRRG